MSFHSFSSPEENFEPIYSFKYKGHRGEVVDVSKWIFPKYWNQASVIYSEMSWRFGYKRFMERAGKEGEYRDYLIGIEKLINQLDIPVYLIGPIQVLKGLKPDRIMKVSFHTASRPKDDGYLGIWKGEGEFYSHVQVQHYISMHYGTVLDFSCGYLSIADNMLPRVRFFVSDVNPKCVGGAYAKLRGYYGQTTETK